MQNEAEKTKQEGASQGTDLLQQAMAGSLPVPANGTSRAVVFDNEGKGGILGWLTKDAETRRHEAVVKATRNVTGESILAVNCLGVVADDIVSVALETEQEMEGAIYQYRNSAMAMAAAPTYVQLARGLFMSGVSDVGKAAVQHITNKIGNR